LCLFIGTTSKCHFSTGLPSGSRKSGTFAIPKFWTLIYFLNQFLKENANTIFYSSQQDCSNDVQHAPIRPHLTLAFKGFVVKNQIIKLTPAFFLYHNFCKSGLNEQCEGILNIYTSIPFESCPRGPIWYFFPFPTKALNILNSHTCVTPKMGGARGSHWASSLAFSPIVKVCFTPKHILRLMGPCSSHLIVNPMLWL
jgi:hypothetical protein